MYDSNKTIAICVVFGVFSRALTGLACSAIYYFLIEVTVAEFIASQTNIKVCDSRIIYHIYI